VRITPHFLWCLCPANRASKPPHQAVAELTRPRTVGRLVAALAMGAVCTWVMMRAAQSGWADFNALQAEQLVNLRIKDGQAMDGMLLARAQALLETAVAWNPGNGSAHENLVVVHRMALLLPDIGFAERDQHVNAALTHALKAAVLRPTSGYAYSLVALAKQTRGQRDSVFRQALSQAARFGPWEPGVQKNIIDAGSQGWEALDEPGREVVRLTIVRTQEAYPDDARTFLLARRWTLPNCTELRIPVAGICPGKAGTSSELQSRN